MPVLVPAPLSIIVLRRPSSEVPASPRLQLMSPVTLLATPMTSAIFCDPLSVVRGKEVNVQMIKGTEESLYSHVNGSDYKCGHVVTHVTANQ